MYDLVSLALSLTLYGITGYTHCKQNGNILDNNQCSCSNSGVYVKGIANSGDNFLMCPWSDAPLFIVGFSLMFMLILYFTKILYYIKSPLIMVAYLITGILGLTGGVLQIVEAASPTDETKAFCVNLATNGFSCSYTIQHVTGAFQLVVSLVNFVYAFRYRKEYSNKYVKASQRIAQSPR